MLTVFLKYTSAHVYKDALPIGHGAYRLHCGGGRVAFPADDDLKRIARECMGAEIVVIERDERSMTISVPKGTSIQAKIKFTMSITPYPR